MARNVFKSLENEILVYKNNLLGYYNINNLYMINPNIVSDLIDYPKTIDKIDDNKISCSCYICGYGSISFEIEFTSEENKIVASLYLLENIGRLNGCLTDPLRTLIAVYENKPQSDFVERVTYAFNLNDDSTVLEQPNIEDANKSYIYNRKFFNEKMYSTVSQNYNRVLKDLVDKQMSYLKKNKNPFSKQVLAIYEEQEKELKNTYLKNGKVVDYFAIYELLNMCIDEVLMTDPSLKKIFQGI